MLAAVARLTRLQEAGATYGTAFRNPSLRRAELAYGSAIAAEWAAVVAVAVFAYAAGGASRVAFVGVIRMLPAALATPFAAVAGDRFGRERVLVALELGGSAALGAAAAVFFADRSEGPIYALIGVLAILSTLTRPTVSSLLPSLATTPEELIAANGAALTTESLGTLAGPALGGVLVAVSSPGTVFAVAGGVYLAAALQALGIRVEGRLGRQSREAGRELGHELLAGFGVVVRESRPRLVVTRAAAGSAS